MEQLRDENRNEKLELSAQQELVDKDIAREFMEEVPDIAFDSNDKEDQEDYSNVKTDRMLKKSLQNRHKFPNLIAQSLRFGTPARVVAALASATLIDVGYVTEEDSSMVIDKSKVMREREKLMKQLRSAADDKYKEEDIKCILFDGRKNLTNILEKDEETGRYYQSRIKLEHIVVTSEPGGEYLFHFVPEEATKENKPAKQVAVQIVDWLVKYGVDSTLGSIGGDSTNSNTGREGGSFTHIEKLLGEKKMWLVCYLHTNELPLRHLIEQLDGKTTSTHGFEGPLGKGLDDVINLDINPKFTLINVGKPPIELDEEIIADLSSDQKYGYRMVVAIRAGKVPVELANMDIGPVNHSRWLTTANRFMRLYVSKHCFKGKTLNNLKCIVEFIVGVYYPMWFEAKVKHSFIFGPRHVLKQLELVRLQKLKVQDIVGPHIARSAWYSHSESVLQTLLCSEEREDREFAVDMIAKVRGENKQGDLRPRSRVHADTFNAKATKLVELCSWESNVFEPVLTCSLTLETLRMFIDRPMVVPYRPVHAQSVERAVKEVTRACATV